MSITIFAALPFLIALALMIFFHFSSGKALLLSLAVTCLLSLMVWKMEIHYLAGFLVYGFLKSLDLLLIIGGAILLLNTLKRTGVMQKINHGFQKISPDQRIQAIIIAYLFGAFIEGAAGYGTPAALAAPLLTGLGFPPVLACALTLISNSTPVPFAAAGTPTLTNISNLSSMITEKGISVSSFTETLTHKTVLYLGLGGIFIPLLLVIVMILSGPRQRRVKSILEMIPYCLFSAFSFLIPYYLFGTYLGPEFASVVSSVIGLVLCITAASRHFLVPGYIWRFPSSEGTEEAACGSINWKEVLSAWIPYILIAAVLLITRIPQFGIKEILNSFSIHFPSVLGLDDISYDLALFYNPGLIPFVLVSLGTVIVFRKKLSGTDIRKIFTATGHQMGSIALTLVCGLSMVQIMMHTNINTSGLDDMLTLISNSIVEKVGTSFPVFSPLLGVFGAFVSGSCTVSGILFGPLQFQTATSLGLCESSVMALQMAGGAIGNMICIHNVAAVSSTAGATGQEGKIITKNLLPCLLYVILVYIVYLFFG